MADRLTGMEVFVGAIRLGSLSAVARHLRISPTMAAKHLDALENRLGATLVHRTTRRLSLTEAGRDYLDRAERILLDLREAEAEASSQSVTATGLLRISAPATFGVHHIAPLAPIFRILHPHVTLEFEFNDRYVDLLEERWDLAIRIGRLSDSSLIARKLVETRIAVCASPDYLARCGTPLRLTDLAGHDCLGYTNISQAGPMTWAFGDEGAIKVPVRGTLYANNGEALIRAAIAGHGLVYGPRFIAADALRSGELVEIMLDHPPMPMGAVHVVYHPTRRPAAKTRAWIAFLAERLPELGADW
ncbi:LysR family transcriptional regulator [Tardiphaga sp.]|uniref:LysR family transcriptional regulator n=1 Tax=Tardiphaga sp. TaxID=1926292 RepID=UPI00352B5F08